VSRIAQAPGRPSVSAFGAVLRQWRTARRLSQLALAAEAEISSRHLCFLETGRAQPSREMVHLLASALDLSLADRNAMLLAAGFAPAYAERPLQAPEMEPIRRALEFILSRQEPYPALVVDAGWNVVLRNEATARLLGLFLEPGALTPAQAGNALHLVCHPDGLRRFLVNWEELAGPLIQAIHREAAGGANPVAARLRDELLAYPGMPARWRMPDPRAPSPPVLAMRLRRGDLAVTFFSTLTMLATPRDVTLEQLRIECFYPGDRETEDVARRLAVGGGASGAAPP
jgi:transcriptional regulator with XRE-family HTH domain